MRVRCFAHTARARTQTSRSAVQRKNQSAITSGTADPLVYRFSHTRQVIHRCELHQEKNTAFFCNHTKLKSHLSGRNDPSKSGLAFMFLGMSWRKKFTCKNLPEIAAHCTNIPTWKCLSAWEATWRVSCLTPGPRMVFQENTENIHFFLIELVIISDWRALYLCTLIIYSKYWRLTKFKHALLTNVVIIIITVIDVIINWIKKRLN